MRSSFPTPSQPPPSSFPSPAAPMPPRTRRDATKGRHRMTARTPRLGVLGALLAVGGLVLSGCAGTGAPASTDSASAGSAEGFPATFEHVYGETTIDSAP